MNSAAITVIDFGVDYITVTATREPRITSLRDVAKEHLQSEARLGNEVSQWRGLGYAGWTSGAVSYGVGPQGVLARMTSGYAAENWKDLFHWGSRCTRIDLQFTAVEGKPAPTVIAKRWRAILRHWRELKRGAEPELRLGPRGPTRITFASRQSERYGRIYDKGVESGLPYYADSVRSEGEFKGSVAQAMALHLIAKPRALDHICPPLLAFLRKHRAAPAWTKLPPAHISGMASATDDDGRLAYLGQSIRPLVRRLLSRRSSEEVLEALGLVGEVRLATNDYMVQWTNNTEKEA